MIKHDLQRYKGMIATVTGELEVAMLHYDEKERTFSMKVLRGRNLAPRDLPSRTSDPYVIVTASPDWNNQGQQRSRILNGWFNVVLIISYIEIVLLFATCIWQC